MIVKALKTGFELADSIQTGHRFEQVGSVLFLSDIYLVLIHGVSITEVNLGWLKDNVDLASVVLFIFFCFIFLCFVTPCIRLLMSLPYFLVLLRRITVGVKDSFTDYLEGKNDLLAHAIGTDSSVSWKLYDKMIDMERRRLVSTNWSFAFLFSLTVSIFMTYVTGGGLMAGVWIHLAKLQSWLAVVLYFSTFLYLSVKFLYCVFYMIELSVLDILGGDVVKRRTYTPGSRLKPLV